MPACVLSQPRSARGHTGTRSALWTTPRWQLVDDGIRRVVEALASSNPSERPSDASDAVTQLDDALQNYRPVVTHATLARWLDDERQTLPQKLLAAPRDTATGRNESTQESASESARRAWRVALAGFGATLFVAVGAATIFNATRGPATQMTASNAGFTENQAVDAVSEAATDTTGDSFEVVVAPPAVNSTQEAPEETAEGPLPEPAAAQDQTLPVPPETVDVTVDSNTSTHAPTESTVTISAAPWARVSVGGRFVGTTPLSSAITLAPGTYAVTFEHPDFPSVERRVELQAGDSTNLAVSMWENVARLELAVSPWAEVIVNGAIRDTIPMDAPLILLPGEHELTLRHPELGSWTTMLSLSADSTYDLRYNLYDLIEE